MVADVGFRRKGLNHGSPRFLIPRLRPRCRGASVADGVRRGFVDAVRGSRCTRALRPLCTPFSRAAANIYLAYSQLRMATFGRRNSSDARSREPMRDHGLTVLLVLNVLWEDDDRRCVVRLRDPHAPVQEVPHPSRRRCLLHEACDVGKHAVQIEFLLVAGATDGRLADCKDRSVVHLGVVQAGDQVGRSGTASGQAHSQFACKLSVCDSHEGGHSSCRT